MPLLGGIFGKKNKSAPSVNGTSYGSSLSPSDIESVLSSPSASYVTTGKSLPSSPNGKNLLTPEVARITPSHVYPSIAGGNSSASSSKLRLPFGRKKSKPPIPEASESSSNANFMPPPRLPYATRPSTSTASDSDASDTWRLRPPPSKSAIFAAYGDPNSALSTRSLPDESMHSWSSMYPPSAPATPLKPPKEKEKRPSLFSWTKSSSSGPAKPPPSEPPRLTNLDSPPRLDIDSSSFNLKSFRHVRPPSPTASTSSLVVPPARPRGTSIASDSSQRISVAAFREAQARKSTADSPAPSFRSPSPSLPIGFPPDGQRGRASPRPSPVIQSHSSPRLKNGVYNERRRSTNIAVGYTSESEESTTSSEEESDEEGAADGKNGSVQRGGTIKSRIRTSIGTRQAKSEIGHGSLSYDSPATTNSRHPFTFSTTKTYDGPGQVDNAARQSSFVANSQYSPVEPPPPRSNSSLGIYGDTARQRASNSTSALSPTPAAKRASILASANAVLNQDPLTAVKQNTRHVRDSSICSNPAPQPQPKAADTSTSDSESDSDSDTDNAPLASLVPPRRPGSALSSASNTSLRTNGTRGPAGRAMSKPLIDINELTTKKPSLGPYRDNEEGFTKGGLLAGHLSNQASSILVESPTSTGSSPLSGSGFSATSVTSRSPPGFGHFVPPTSPPKEIQAYASLSVKPGSSTSRPQPQPIQKPEIENEIDGERILEKKRDVLAERLVKLAKGKEKEISDRSITLGGSFDMAGGRKKFTSSPPQEIPLQPATPPQPQITQPSAPSIAVSSKPSLPDDDLIQDVDDSILRLISRMGEFEGDARMSLSSLAEGDKDDDTSDSESDAYGESENGKSEDDGKVGTSKFEMSREPDSEKEGNRIAPILIRQREPLPSFSVMSRPPVHKPVEDDMRSGLTAASSSTNAITNDSTRFSASSARNSTATDIYKPTSNSTLNSFVSSTPISSPSAITQQRLSTLVPPSPSTSATTSESSSSTFGASTSSFAKTKSPSRGGESNVVSPSNAGTSATGGRSNSRPNPANPNRASVLRTVASGEIGTKTAASISPGQTARQRSSSLVPLISTSNSRPNQFGPPAPASSLPPAKPFAGRRDSPASSTGDSSSTRAPLTPKDGSDIGSSKTALSSGKEKKGEWSSGVSGLGTSNAKGGVHAGKHGQRRSVSFDDDVDMEVKGKKSKDRVSEDEAEARRRERRRGEAKAAIELGNVINGPGPVVSDDEDDLPINQAMNPRMSAMNPMMAMPHPMQMQMSYSGAPGSPAGWGGNLPLPQMPQMLSPAQFMMPPPANPNYMAAHQQAMMFAKQAYQMAVAQQAMAVAADEWDRNSVMGGSVYGGPSSNASVMMGPSPYNMMSMGGMGNGWSNGPMVFPNSSQSVYGVRGGISSSRSEFGGPSSVAAGNWSSARSSYGESFGPSERLRHGGGNKKSGVVRDSGYYPPMPPIPQSHSGGSSSSGTKGRLRTASGPATTNRGGMKRPPPSSWKSGV